MKGFISSLIACVIFFAAFGISTGILGVNTDAVSMFYNESPDYSVDGEMLFSGNTVKSDEWKINHDFEDIIINSSGINTVVTCSDRSNIFVSLSNDGNRNIHLEAVYTINSLNKSSILTFNVSPESSFIFSGGLINCIGGFLSGINRDVTLNIELPLKIYGALEVNQGSGTVRVEEMYARYNKIDIGSGYFELNRSNDTENITNTFKLTLGSGRTEIRGMNTERYDLDIGSGSFNIDGLTGSGEIEMGSGNGTVAFDKYNGECNVDLGSGNLKLLLPVNASANIKCDIGSGSVNIDAGGVHKNIGSRDDYETVPIGSGMHGLNIDMGSGHISIEDTARNSETVVEGVVYYSMLE